MYLRFQDLTYTQQQKIKALPDYEPYWEKGTKM